jgi:hypothetical protein
VILRTTGGNNDFAAHHGGVGAVAVPPAGSIGRSSPRIWRDCRGDGVLAKVARSTSGVWRPTPRASSRSTERGEGIDNQPIRQPSSVDQGRKRIGRPPIVFLESRRQVLRRRRLRAMFQMLSVFAERSMIRERMKEGIARVSSAAPGPVTPPCDDPGVRETKRRSAAPGHSEREVSASIRHRPGHALSRRDGTSKGDRHEPPNHPEVGNCDLRRR